MIQTVYKVLELIIFLNFINSRIYRTKVIKTILFLVSVCIILSVSTINILVKLANQIFTVIYI